jgi:hypothetical protein
MKLSLLAAIRVLAPLTEASELRPGRRQSRACRWGAAPRYVPSLVRASARRLRPSDLHRPQPAVGFLAFHHQTAALDCRHDVAMTPSPHRVQAGLQTPPQGPRTTSIAARAMARRCCSRYATAVQVRSPSVLPDSPVTIRALPGPTEGAYPLEKHRNLKGQKMHQHWPHPSCGHLSSLSYAGTK